MIPLPEIVASSSTETLVSTAETIPYVDDLLNSVYEKKTKKTVLREAGKVFGLFYNKVM